MSGKKVEKQAFEYFKSGYWCSESVFKSITEQYTNNVDSSLSRLTSGLIGGMGSSHQEACGALTGGIVALGYLYGRTDPKGDIQLLKEMVVKYRERFKKEFGTTNCGVLLDRFGEQGDDYIKCRELTARAARILMEIIEEYQNK
ncbi:MAG: C_GCAxxG_C_C family protein [Candidatus Zixiibacteriota bacterium]|nr:MAG: C_GCAxxG_C_C family protein [candidate division Zixibacteria bacterium]